MPDTRKIVASAGLELTTIVFEQQCSQRLEPTDRSPNVIHSPSLARQTVLSTLQMQVLVVFNVVYNHMLLGQDDKAFNDESWPLSLAEVQTVVTFMKRFIYDRCWTISPSNSLSADSMEEKKLILFAEVVSSIKLFNQLYDRDCRRCYMPNGAWLWPSMPVIKEFVDLELKKEDGNRDAHAIFSADEWEGVILVCSRSSYSRHDPSSLIFQRTCPAFQKLLEDGKAKLGNVRDEFSQALQVWVKRDEIVNDSFDFFQKVCDTMSPASLKMRIKITFSNEQGLQETGIDGGGVFKEYMDCLTKCVSRHSMVSFRKPSSTFCTRILAHDML